MLYGSDASQFEFDSCRGLRWIPFVRPVPHQQHHLYALRRAGECVSKFDECFINWFLLQLPHSREVSVNSPNSNQAETKSLLRNMVAEANDLKQAAGGTITDAVAGWLASQYLLASREKLTATKESGRFEVLRTFVQDWAMLRHGDHTAERLHIERERLKLAKRDTRKKWETKIQAGLEEIGKEIKNNPKAKALFKPLYELMRAYSQPRKEKEFREWIKRPEIRKEIFPELTRGLSPETLKKIEEELRLL